MPDIWIRMATPSDWPQIHPLVTAFHAEFFTHTPFKINVDSIQPMLNALTINPNNIMIIGGTGTAIYGLIAGCILPNSFDATQKVAAEMMWYVTEGYRGSSLGLRLLREYEKWAKGMGASIITLGHLDIARKDEKNAVYKRLGYTEVEVHAAKEL